MSEPALQIAIRLDTEDFLTAESDQALGRILDVLDARGIRATFPVVAAKLRLWQRRGRRDLIRRLARHAVGYHSDTHSLHPTIAEELAPLPWAEACTAFAARERAGFDQVAAAFGPPACWTQPGGNWTAPALAVARDWGIPMEFSESWNSYLDVGPAPCRFAGILHWSPPVSAPKPFLSGLPGNLDGAVAAIRRQAAAGGVPLCVVAHPTEICTTAFWDAVNFAGGRMPPQQDWHPAPLRPAGEVEAAVAALDRYLGTLQRMGASFVTAREVAARHPDIAPGVTLPAVAVRALARVWAQAGEVDAAVCGGLALSAAEIFALLVRTLAAAPSPTRALAARRCDGPAASAPAPAPAAACRREAVVTAARRCDAFVAAHGRLPEAVPVGTAEVPPASFAVAAAALVADPGAAGTPLGPAGLAPARIVKPPARLHWDWPIFPPGFAPVGLREGAVLQTWTWKPAPPLPAPPDWRADRWLAAAR